MKGISRKSLLEQVLSADYSKRDECPHSPSFNIPNLKRRKKIVAKMRKAGITEDEIDFIADFSAADAVHVVKLLSASDASEAQTKQKN